MPLDAYYVDADDVLRPFGGAATPPEPDDGFPPHTIFGAGVTPLPGSGLNHLQAWDAHIDALGEPAICRTYNAEGAQSDGWNWWTISGSQSPRIRGWEDRWSHISPKPTLSRVLSGEAHDEIVASVNTIPVTGHKRLITMWHEPEPKISSGKFTPAEWKRAAYLYGLAVAEAAHPDVMYGPCFTGRWHIFDTALLYAIMNSTDDDLASVCDFVAWDPYNEASRQNNYNANRQGEAGCNYYFGPCFDFTDEWFPDARFVVGETGYVPNPANPGLRAAWITAMCQYLADRDVLAVEYFDASIEVCWWLRVRQTTHNDRNTNVADPATAAAWSAWYTSNPLP